MPDLIERAEAMEARLETRLPYLRGGADIAYFRKAAALIRELITELRKGRVDTLGGA